MCTNLLPSSIQVLRHRLSAADARMVPTALHPLRRLRRMAIMAVHNLPDTTRYAFACINNRALFIRPVQFSCRFVEQRPGGSIETIAPPAYARPYMTFPLKTSGLKLKMVQRW